MNLQGVVTGSRPDVTPIQMSSMLVAGIPIISNLLAAFGVFHPSPEQQDALTNSINWAVPFAGLLLGADGIIRHGRNTKDAIVQAAAFESGSKPHDEVIDPSEIPTKDPDPEEIGAEVEGDNL